MMQVIHTRLQASSGDVHIEPGSKKRKTSGSSKGKPKTRVVHANSETSEGMNVMDAVPGQPPHPFPDWPGVNFAGTPANPNMSLNLSGPSVTTGPAGSDTTPFSAAVVSGSVADFSFMLFLKFFMESMNHLLLTFKSNQLTVQCTIKEQQQQFSSHLESLHAKIAQTDPASSSGWSPTHGFHTEEDGSDGLLLPPKKRKWRSHHVKGNTQVVDRDVDMVTYNQFLQYVHDHLLTLLGIKDLKNIADAKARCMISEAENKAFIQELPGSIQIMASNFRLDLSQDQSTLFNHTAMEDSWYNSLPIPMQYLQVDIISDCFYYHLKHVKSCYKHFVVHMALDSEAAQIKEDKRLQRMSQAVRKVRLYKWCLNAIAEDPQLSTHKHLLEALGTQGMSLDESDTEVPGKSTTYPHIYPQWHSQQLSSFLWKLDAIIEKIHALLIGRHK
ncbi:hypothetical protein EDD16DRAFT_1526109 [Pisolithus croceorrhizus]|nr:hypothetical protein EDD16DRAFT_1526109 [Pisolithus croceorrhizus]KAI6167156.1 hypothetical protein EDD17DRAFT_1504856 [Pisolithus thermaeus]